MSPRLGLTACGAICGGEPGDVGARAELGVSVRSQAVGCVGRPRGRQRSALAGSSGAS